MSVEFQDVLKVELVLVGIRLLNNPDEINAFTTSVRTDVNANVLGPIVELGTPEPGRLVQLPRDRVDLLLVPSRSILRRQYPSHPDDLNRLREVIGHAIGNTSLDGQEIRAHGYNVDIVYNQTSGQTAARYLANRLFPAGLLVSEGRQLVGGGGKIDLQDDKNRWTVRVEPRNNNHTEMRVFLSVNMHRDEQVMPDQTDIQKSLSDIWDQVHKFAHLLDEGSK